MYGGTGLAAGLVNNDPDSRAPEAAPGREGRTLADIWMLDMENVETDCSFLLVFLDLQPVVLLTVKFSVQLLFLCR